MADQKPRFPAAAARWTTTEGRRIGRAHDGGERWHRWGPYLSERQWGTVREDYSAGGSAWDEFPHDHARSRAYRWGEDGLAGFSDDQQRLCLSLALWNHHDPILKERLFGLTNSEGNHGEDVKELYYYLDAAPSHAYLRMLYKYPQQAFPYEQLLRENARRGAADDEFELLDSGLFDEDRYFDVVVEYAQRQPGDIFMRIEVHNRGPEDAEITIVPQVQFRNTWSWGDDAPRPELRLADGSVELEHHQLGLRRAYYESDAEALFTDNDTNHAQLHGQAAGAPAKDAFHRLLVDGESEATRADGRGTKLGLAHRRVVRAGASTVVRLRVTEEEPKAPLRGFDKLVGKRRAETDAFYHTLQSAQPSAECALVQRQAFAGMVWSKQFYHYDVPRWLAGDPGQPAPPEGRKGGRNAGWTHLNNADILSMPDKWEYPWYAAWDLAFHCLPLAVIDAGFAKEQLTLLTREWYLHPNGQIPAYEWAFDDVNPPVHAWATWRVFQIDRAQRGDQGDLQFLERVFHKLMLNFTWWVNRKDEGGKNIFQGGFLGLDNIGLFDRSAPLPAGAQLSQADGTSWMAMYSLNLMRIALELARHNPVYEDIATKFFEHFLHIAHAMTQLGAGGEGLWDEQDQFYYDWLHFADGTKLPMRTRSMVGLIPIFAVETLEPELLEQLPGFERRLRWVMDNLPELASQVSRWQKPGIGERRLLSLLRGHRLKALLRRALDETEFLSNFGVRSVSKVHERAPYRLELEGRQLSVEYWPGESRSGLFGGNSNWRGPIWFPLNYLLIESLRRHHHYYGDDFTVECPVDSGQMMTLAQVADELSTRLARLFLPGPDGTRPVSSLADKTARDPHFRNHVLFYEYFHGDSGRGVGASHQTGWTGLIAKLLQAPAATTAERK